MSAGGSARLAVGGVAGMATDRPSSRLMMAVGTPQRESVLFEVQHHLVPAQSAPQTIDAFNHYRREVACRVERRSIGSHASTTSKTVTSPIRSSRPRVAVSLYRWIAHGTRSMTPQSSRRIPPSADGDRDRRAETRTKR